MARGGRGKEGEKGLFDSRGSRISDTNLVVICNSPYEFIGFGTVNLGFSHREK